MRAQPVLSKLRRGEAPDVRAVACIMSGHEAEEAIAYWLQHKLSEGTASSLSIVVGDRPPTVVAWQCPEKQGLSTSSQWLSFVQKERTVMRTVKVLCLGAAEAPRNPVVQKPDGAVLPKRSSDAQTVRLTVFAKYTADKLTSQYAGSLLKQIWPASKSARHFANWRAYVSGTPALVDCVLAKSGASPLFVSKLAKRKVIEESLRPYWVPRTEGCSDHERLQQASS